MIEVIESNIKHPKYESIPNMKTISFEIYGKSLIFKAEKIESRGKANILGANLKKYSSCLSLVNSSRENSHLSSLIRADIFYLDVLDAWFVDKKVLNYFKNNEGYLKS